MVNDAGDAVKDVISRGNGLTASTVDLVTLVLLASVTFALTVKLPLTVGVQDKVAELDDVHPVGRPE
jgi:hypothetical protein